MLLELLYSARSRVAYRELAADLALLPMLATSSTTERLALANQARLAERSQHRGATPTDLLIAAVAEHHRLTLVHYDRHFDAIERVTGQSTVWLARRGSLD